MVRTFDGLVAALDGEDLHVVVHLGLAADASGVDELVALPVLISSVLGGDLSKNFKVVKETKDGDLLKLELDPIKKDLNINSLQVTINTNDKVLKSLSYADDIGNLTTMNFSHVQFLKKEKKNLFKYQPPKGAQVTDL